MDCRSRRRGETAHCTHISAACKNGGGKEALIFPFVELLSSLFIAEYMDARLFLVRVEQERDPFTDLRRLFCFRLNFDWDVIRI